MKDRYSPLLVIAAVSVITFLPHLTGYGVFVGDSDRMNHSLTVLAAFVKGFSEHKLLLWNDTVFGGYSLVALPYDYPNPIMLLAALLGVENIYTFAGFESAALFFLAGVSTYCFLLGSGRSPLAACVGAVLYQTCALPVLKVAQNDMSFMVIVLIPILMLLIRRTAERVSVKDYVLLFGTVAIILNFTFLQKASYTGLLAGAYVLWLSIRRRTWQPVVICGLAALPALIIAVPRILTIADDFEQATRFYAFGSKDFSSLYGFLGFSKIEILRWFDERIFGATFEGMTQLGNSFNLHEGFLLFATSFGPFLLGYVLYARLPWRRKDDEANFFVWVLATCILLVLTKAGYWLLWKLFFEIDFIHLRLLVIAVLPYCALLALVVDEIDGERILYETRWRRLAWLVASTVGAAALMVALELVSRKLADRGLTLPISDSRHVLDYGALLRIGASALLLIGLWQLARRKFDSETIRYALATLLMTQGAVFAATFVWGPGHWPTPPAFKSPTNLMARPGDYRTPSPKARAALRNRLESDQYRTSFICPPQDIAIFCSTHIANFWELRTMEGYVSTLPKRLADLPWNPNVVTLRSITHLSTEMLNWSLLGLFNVKYALMYRPELLTNAVRQPGQPVRELSPDDLTILQNPLPVTPRLFFAKNVKAAATEENAVAILFPQHKANPAGYHPEDMSVAEGLPQDRSFTAGSAVAKLDRGYIVVETAPASHEQFLVLNERYDPNWVAWTSDGKELRVLPTNVAMQGVVVPPQTYRVTFSYRPYMIRTKAFLLYLFGLVLALTAAGGIWRFTQARRATG